MFRSRRLPPRVIQRESSRAHRSSRSQPLRLAVAAAVLAAFAAPSSFAAVYVFSNPLGGDLNISTNYSPAGTPGAADTVRITALPTIPGFLTLNVAANQSIGRLEVDHFGPTTIASSGGTLTLSTGQLAFTDAITDAPDAPLDTLFFYAPIAGGNGLIKTGPGFAFLNGNNLYTGGTTISGPGGLSVTKDAALGDSSGGVTLNSGGTLRAYNSFATNRAFTIDTGGGRIESFGTLTLNGAIGGTGTLTVGRFTGGAVTINSSANTLSGGLVIGQSNTVNLFGRLGSVSSVTLGGTLNLGVGTIGPSVDAINDATAITGLGGTLNVAPSASNATENLGTLSLVGGTTTINLNASAAAGTQVNFASLSRSNRSTLFVRGRSLGTGTLAAARTVLNVNDVANLPLVGGGAVSGTTVSIVPFIFGNGNPNANGDTIPRNAEYTGLVTRVGGSLRPLDASNYATNPLTAGALDNVRISDNLFTLTGPKTINALVIRDTLGSGGQSGLTGSDTLTVTSGAIVGVSALGGAELVIDNPIAFNGAEGVIHTAGTDDQPGPGYSQLILNGAISGTNGLTKSGTGDLFLNGSSSYSGVTTINAGTVFVSGNVGVNSNSALGNSNNDIVINAGVTDNQYVGLIASANGATIGRNIVVRQSANANSFALLGTGGSNTATFSGQITVEGGFLNLLGSVSPDALSITGPIVGAGGIQEPANVLPPRIVRLSGASSYTGGTQIRSGRWQIGSNSALGNGTVYFIGNGVADDDQTGSIEAFGGARSLANAIVLRATPVIAGTDALTFTGSIDLGGTARTVNVTNTADTTFAGVVVRGGLVKMGAGRLILANANTYNGQTLVNEGTLRITNGVGLGVATGPAGEGQATFLSGAASLELAGGITTGETIFLGSDSPITSTLPAGNLRSVTGNNVINGQIGFDNVAAIGVDAGSTLTLTADGVDNTSSGNAALRKVGGGALVVKNVRLSSLAISEGTVRVAPGTLGTGTSRVSSLTVATGATLDLTSNALIYDYSTGSPSQSVRQTLQDGRTVTSVATSGAAVGYGEASTIFAANTFPNTFAGQSVDSTTLLLIQTLRGDANLDRTVNFSDLLALAQNYGLSGKIWTDGDFTYDGVVDFSDLLPLAQNYNGTVSGSIVTGQLGADFAADWARAQSMVQSLVPEPAALSVLGLGVLMRRRRA